MKSQRRIMIDARIVIAGQGHGIERHSRELVSHLMERFHQEGHDDLHFILLVVKSSPLLKMQLPSSFTLHVMRSSWMSLWGQLELLFVIWKFRPALFHSPSFIVPLFSSVPLVATIHDLNHVVLAENYSLAHKIYYSVFLRHRLKNIKHVITVSRFSRDEICRYFNIASEKVAVIYNGISEGFQPQSFFAKSALDAFRTRFSLPEKYILAVGNKKPHKNLGTLLEAYCQGHFSLPLIIVSERSAEFQNILARHHKEADVFFLARLSEEDITFLYTLATVFVYPSLYEGFGMPPLEAASCGVPVVVSQGSSLPEVLEDAACYVDPKSSADIARGISEVLNKEPLQLQKSVDRGMQIAKRYSWSKMADETLALYRKMLQL